jgi:glutamate racemase
MLQHSSNPIGIFDSGMGGLTVAKTITQLLPNESIVYFGDTAHVPWGDKSTAAIQAYSIKICDVLLQHRCKFIVIACHTASTAAYDLVREYVGNKAHVINVVDPVITHIRKNHANKKIGLIGTKQTVRSNVYKKRVDLLNCNIEFSALATPLLVPLIEEGFAEKEVAEIVIKEYLAHANLSDIKALILGCTHYPLLKPYIQKYYQDTIDIIDASEITAQVLKEHLSLYKLFNPNNTIKKLFYVSDYSEFFLSTAKIFFPEEIKLEPYPLWE